MKKVLYICFKYYILPTGSQALKLGNTVGGGENGSG